MSWFQQLSLNLHRKCELCNDCVIRAHPGVRSSLFLNQWALVSKDTAGEWDRIYQEAPCLSVTTISSELSVRTHLAVKFSALKLCSHVMPMLTDKGHNNNGMQIPVSKCIHVPLNDLQLCPMSVTRPPQTLNQPAPRSRLEHYIILTWMLLVPVTSSDTWLKIDSSQKQQQQKFKSTQLKYHQHLTPPASAAESLEPLCSHWNLKHYIFRDKRHCDS